MFVATSTVCAALLGCLPCYLPPPDTTHYLQITPPAFRSNTTHQHMQTHQSYKCRWTSETFMFMSIYAHCTYDAPHTYIFQNMNRAQMIMKSHNFRHPVYYYLSFCVSESIIYICHSHQHRSQMISPLIESAPWSVSAGQMWGASDCKYSIVNKIINKILRRINREMARYWSRVTWSPGRGQHWPPAQDWSLHFSNCDIGVHPYTGWPVCHDLKQGSVNQVFFGVFKMF